MSSTPEQVEKISKKRKHDGDSKESKKKRRQVENAAETNNHDDLSLKIAKKEKKRKEKEQRAEDSEDAGQNGLSTTSSNATEMNGVSKVKGRKKAAKSSQEVQSEAELDDTKLVSNSQPDEDMPDVPATGEEESIVDEAGTTQDETVEDTTSEQLRSDAETSFHSIRMSLYLPIPAIASSGTISALSALHLSPLLLTYFPPAGGVILSYHDPVLSARPQPQVSRALVPPDNGDTTLAAPDDTYSKLGEESGASWVWLTVGFLVFKPQPGEELHGWTNAMSEGFVGLVSYNYFQTSISKSRIPKSWMWDGPSRHRSKQRKTPRKGKLNDSDEPSQETVFDSQETVVAREDDAIDGMAGSFVDENGTQVSEDLTFRVVDLEIIPAQERGQRFALQLEGTLLEEEEEQAVREEERQKWENRMNKKRSRSRTPGTPMMSGGLPTHSRAGSVFSTP